MFSPYRQSAPRYVSNKKRMLSTVASLALLGAVIGLSTGATCTPAQTKTVVNDVILTEQALCVIANATLKVPEILTVCNITSQLAPDVQKIVDSVLSSAAHKAGCAAK